LLDDNDSMTQVVVESTRFWFWAALCALLSVSGFAIFSITNVDDIRPLVRNSTSGVFLVGALWCAVRCGFTYIVFDEECRLIRINEKWLFVLSYSRKHPFETFVGARLGVPLRTSTPSSRQRSNAIMLRFTTGAVFLSTPPNSCFHMWKLDFISRVNRAWKNVTDHEADLSSPDHQPYFGQVAPHPAKPNNTQTYSFQTTDSLYDMEDTPQSQARTVHI